MNNPMVRKMCVFVVDVMIALAVTELMIDMLNNEPASAMLVIVLPIAIATRVGSMMIKVR